MNRAFFAGTALVGAALLVACGSQVTNATSSTSGGSGGATASTSGTGAGGATTGTGGATTTGTGGAPAACGGKAGVSCGPGQWCDYPAGAMCGNFDAQGLCQPLPLDCAPDDCPGACGCDGLFYCNGCLANLAGVDTTGDLACAPDDVYVAQSLFTNLPRYVILKRSVSRSLCFQLIAEPVAGTAFAITGDGWSITQARVTDDVIDCTPPPGFPPPPLGASFDATSGSGALSTVLSVGACTVGIHATVTFSGGPAWVPPQEPFDADGLSVSGGCN
jgi:hypothetical protein